MPLAQAPMEDETEVERPVAHPACLGSTAWGTIPELAARQPPTPADSRVLTAGAHPLHGFGAEELWATGRAAGTELRYRPSPMAADGARAPLTDSSPPYAALCCRAVAVTVPQRAVRVPAGLSPDPRAAAEALRRDTARRADALGSTHRRGPCSGVGEHGPHLAAVPMAFGQGSPICRPSPFQAARRGAANALRLFPPR